MSKTETKSTRIREKAETRSIEKNVFFFFTFFGGWGKFDPNHTLTLQNFYIYKYTLAAAVRVLSIFYTIFFRYHAHTQNVSA